MAHVMYSFDTKHLGGHSYMYKYLLSLSVLYPGITEKV